MIFIGIDLAWTEKNETGICVLDDSGKVLRHDAAVFSDGDLVEVICAYGDHEVCVGIDGPVVVKNETGSRAAEGEMMRDSFHGHRLRAFNTNRQYLLKTFAGIRGENILAGLKATGVKVSHTDVFGEGDIRVMEVFPTGICLGLWPELYPLKYKVKARVSLAEAKKAMARLMAVISGVEEEGKVRNATGALKGDLSPLKPKAYKHLEDKVDAFLCAYSMLEVYRGEADQRLYGSEASGMIMVSVRKR